MILKKHTNELLKVIIEQGKDVNNFELYKHENSLFGEFIEINYKNSPMSFWVLLADTEDFDLFNIRYTKFLPKYPEQGFTTRYNLNEVKDIFKGWIDSSLNKYIENLTETDYWEIIRNNPLKIESIDFTKNVPFQIEEREQLKLGLEEIKVLLSQNFELTAQQLEFANNRIDYLIDATNRLNKTDWKGIAISTIVAIAYDLSFDEHKRSMLFGLFSKLWAVVQQLPPTILS